MNHTQILLSRWISREEFSIFFPLDLIYVLSYRKSFICTIIFEKLFASLVDQCQVGFLPPSGVTAVRAKSTTSSIIRDFDPNLSLMCLNVSLLANLGVFIFFIFKEKVQVMLTWQVVVLCGIKQIFYFSCLLRQYFHQSLNSRNHFHIIPKDQVQN